MIGPAQPGTAQYSGILVRSTQNVGGDVGGPEKQGKLANNPGHKKHLIKNCTRFLFKNGKGLGLKRPVNKREGLKKKKDRFKCSSINKKTKRKNVSKRGAL